MLQINQPLVVFERLNGIPLRCNTFEWTTFDQYGTPFQCLNGIPCGPDMVAYEDWEDDE